MRILVPLTLVAASMTSPCASETQRRYNVYKTDQFGNKEVFSQPEAIIEENSLTGDLEVYEATPFGFPDTLRGPTYIIERDSLSGLGRHEHEHAHPEDESLRRHSFDHNDGEKCDSDDEE